MTISISRKQHWSCQIFFTAVLIAIVMGGFLLYYEVHRWRNMYLVALVHWVVLVFWVVLLLSLFLFPRNWLAQNVLPTIRAWWGLERAETRRVFLTASSTTLVCSLIAHGFLFANEFFSHDSLFYLSVDSPIPFRYSIEVGRFFLYSYEGLRGHTTYAPWLIGMLFILWMTFCAIFLVRLLNIQSTSGIILASGLLCTSTTLTATGATYFYCLDEYALALTFAVAAIWLFQRRAVLLGALCIILSMGLYQAYFCTALVLAFFCVIQLISKNRPLSEVIRQGVYYLITLFLSFCLYYMAWTVLCVLFHQEKARLSETLFGADLFALLTSIKDAWIHFFSQYLLNGQEILGALYPAVGILIIFAVLYWSLSYFLSKDAPLSNKVLLLLAFVFMPVALNISEVMFPNNRADLISFQTCLLFIFLVCCREHPPALRISPRRYRAAALALLCLVFWRNVIFSNQAYLQKELVKSSTISLVTRVISRVEAVDGYQPNETPVLFYPYGSFNNAPNLVKYVNTFRFEEITSHTGLDISHSAASTGNLWRYIYYYLNWPMAIIEWPDDNTLTDDELATVEAMPVFPAEGSVAFVGEKVVVKLH